MFTVNRNPSAAELKKFGIAMFIGFFFIGAIMFFAPYLNTRSVDSLELTGSALQMSAIGLPALGLLLWIVSVASPEAAKPIYVTWMSITVPIGIVMSTVLLTVLFVVLLPVFSLIIRFGDPLGKKIGERRSYWEHYKPHAPTIERMKRPF